MLTTSKYEENGFADIIRGLVKIYNPNVVVELGTQQGASAIIIGRAMKQGTLWTYDLYANNYEQPPYKETHANYDDAKRNIEFAGLEDRVRVCFGDACIVHREFNEVDMLHIDLCNHYDNISAILPHWRYKVTKTIILEGGGYNKWQKEYCFKPFTPLLRRHFVTSNYDVCILKKNDDYAITILTRKEA